MSATLNLRHLRVFREVARCKSVSLAAGQVHLSQPAVTQAISKLAKELGVTLFNRRSDGMYLTQIGAIFLHRVERALLHLQVGAQQAIRLGQRKGQRGFVHFDRLVTSAQLRALMATADARNFSIAARKIGISQPSLHRSARNLEQLSGVQMFKTAPEGVSLTPAAQELARRARLAFAELKQGADQVENFLGRDTTRITIGSLPLARTHILPKAIAEMVSAHEGIQIRVVDGPYEELLYRLRRGDFDLLIGALRQPSLVEDVVQQTLFEDPLAIIVGADHPLLKLTAPTLTDTLNYPWVAPPKTTPAGAYLFDTLRIDELTHTPVRVVSSSLIMLRGLLVEGSFITIISRHQARHEIEQKLFAPLPIELPGSARSIGLTFREDWQPTPTQAKFVELIKQAASTVHG